MGEGMKIFKDKSGKRQFERISRWNILEDTIISPKSSNAPYADNYDASTVQQADRLFLTYFKRDGRVVAFNKYCTLWPGLELEDHSVLSKYDKDSQTYLEVDMKARKVRMYREVITE